MAEVTGFAVSKLLSELMGKQVSAALLPKPSDAKVKKIYGIYAGVPSNRAMVVKADLPLLASFAGLLVGLPDATAKERAAETPMHEGVRDAIHETLNIFSTVLSVEERMIFKNFVLDPNLCDSAASKVLTTPEFTTTFNIGIGGAPGGTLTILSRYN